MIFCWFSFDFPQFAIPLMYQSPNTETKVDRSQKPQGADPRSAESKDAETKVRNAKGVDTKGAAPIGLQ